MKFSELKECPFCGNDEFYTVRTARGSSVYHERFDGKEATDNSCMYDCVYFFGGAKAYCNNCDTYLGNRDKDIVSKRAEKAIAERSKE